VDALGHLSVLRCCSEFEPHVYPANDEHVFLELDFTTHLRRESRGRDLTRFQRASEGSE